MTDMTMIPLWAGRDLTPLPYESRIAILLRFAWRNALDYRRLKRLINPRDIRKYEFFNLASGTLSNQPSAPSVGAQEELEFTRADPFGWMHLKLRYCPLCFAHGYHSYWHQHRLLLVCPLHGLELSERCHSCGQQKFDFGVTPQLFNNPYFCDLCGKPICGVSPTVEAFLELKEIEVELESIFLGAHDWRQRTAELQRNIVSITHNLWDSPLGNSCEIKAYRQAILCSLDKPPKNFLLPRYTDVTLLTWRLQLAHVENVPLTLNQWKSSSKKIASAVYRSTLRILDEWMRDFIGVSSEQYLSARKFTISDNVIDVRCLEAAPLALWLMRWQLEVAFGHWEFPINSQPTLGAFANGFIPEHQGRVPRLAYRAIFLAIFASWFNQITLAKDRGRFELNQNLLPYRYVIFECKETDGRCGRSPSPILEGNVIFPSITGITSLIRSPKRLGRRYST